MTADGKSRRGRLIENLTTSAVGGNLIGLYMAKKKPEGWCSTKPSPHQLYMLRMFEKGWVFNLHNKRPGSWNTYWVLLRKGWCENHPNRNRLTAKGKAVLAYYGKYLTPMEAYFKEAMSDGHS